MFHEDIKVTNAEVDSLKLCEVLQVPGTDESLVLSHRKNLEEGSEESCVDVERYAST
jgi:hypothetical protein